MQNLTFLLGVAVFGAFKAGVNVRYADQASRFHDASKREKAMNILTRSNNICLLIYLILAVIFTCKLFIDLTVQSQTKWPVQSQHDALFTIDGYGPFFHLNDNIYCDWNGLPSVVFITTNNSIFENLP